MLDVDEIPFKIRSPNEAVIQNAARAKNAAKAYLDAVNDKKVREAVQSKRASRKDCSRWESLYISGVSRTPRRAASGKVRHSSQQLNHQ
jgi:hypothetical protein